MLNRPEKFIEGLNASLESIQKQYYTFATQESVNVVALTQLAQATNNYLKAMLSVCETFNSINEQLTK